MEFIRAVGDKIGFVLNFIGAALLQFISSTWEQSVFDAPVLSRPSGSRIPAGVEDSW